MIKKPKIFVLLIFVFCINFIQACEDSLTTKVITENILFVSADRAKLSGRIYELANKAEDHGFQLDVSDNFGAAVEMSLGPNTKLGKFIGEFDGLNPHTKYYYRAYVKVATKIYFGEIMSVETGSPVFKSMSPNIGYPGNIITITGSNIPQGVRILVGKTIAEIYDFSLESTLRFKVPQPGEGDTYLSEVRFVMGSDTILFSEPFEYITGEWTKLDDFFEPLRLYDGISFKNGNEFYYGLGIQNNQINDRIWKLNLDSWSWSELNFLMNGFYSGFSGAQGYLGGGVFNWETEQMNEKFWKAEGAGLIELNALPFKLFTPISATVNGILYVGGGQTSRDEDNYFLYKYNSSVDNWEVETSIPFVTNSKYGVFSHQNLIYFFVKDGSLWTYSTDERVWAKIGNYPLTVRTNSICTVIGNKAYFGVGYDNLVLLEYNIEGNSWKEKYRFPGDKAYTNISSFSHNNKIYTLRISPYSSDSFTEIWEFDPQVF